MSTRALSAIGLLVAATTLLGALPVQLPDDVSGAIAEYEENVEPEDWLDGPAEYIITDEERDIWGDLETDDMRRQFIDWFWARRDDDPRDDENPFRREFYERVAYTNRRFSGFPRGWKSDRGRVWIVLGRPNSLRRTSLRGYGRCSAPEGEQWTYYTNDMPIQASFGEFPVYFVETRPGQFEICDPSMLGLGAWPSYLQDAMRLMRRTFIVDPVTEFDPDEGVRRGAPEEIRDTEATEEALDVSLEGWGDPGFGGVAVIPLRIPLRDIFFEPLEEGLRASLQVTVEMRLEDAEQGRRGSRDWTLMIPEAEAEAIGAVDLRTALALNAEPGTYDVGIRIVDPLSSTAWTWQGAVTIPEEGAGLTPPLVGSQMSRLGESGEVAVLSRGVPRVEAGRPVAVVAWIRAPGVDRDDVRVSVVGDDGTERDLEVQQLAWGPEDGAGPLLAQVSTSDLPAGDYTLRLAVGDLEPAEAALQIE
ncbi:MAG: GWxTD domain-containing protein [Acidobacteriota bacterium]